MKERWKPVRRYEGFYEVSNLGRVRSVDRLIVTSANVLRNVKGSVLKPFPTSPATNLKVKPYLQVDLWRDNINKKELVHRLVWEAFNGIIPKHKQVNHKNGVKFDCRLKNLNLKTPKGNMTHAIRKGLNNTKGSHNGSSKLGEADVLFIRELFTTGTYSQKELSDSIGVNFVTIHDIVTRKTWRHI